ncbi:MAG: spermidine/putrescine transport system substrate-binding protein [Frankiales bacterium]|jgi:spermidine/putrescine transport system substrate-binding protein|nr:spermidine/putrescine transport system substrate-binding protein [Frankiales bacterium]
MSRSENDENDVAWLRGMTQQRISRRDALRYAGIGGGAIGLSAFLAACGVSGSKEKQTDVEKFWAGKTQTGTLDFASWPLYIDVDEKTKRHPSLDLFTSQTGIKVKYREVIQDDPSFYGKIQPTLAAGQSIGYDIIVITNGLYLDKLIQQNFLVPLDHTQLPNFAANASPSVKNPSYDPNNKFTVAWQSGMTGIGYNPKYIKRPITSFNDLFDPAFKGKVGMFGDNQDLPNLAIVGTGGKPETSTTDDWKKAADKLKQQKGLVRKYYEQDYIDPLSKGDIWISMAWSGDIFQANASTPGLGLKFAVPDEGGLIWTDNMCIPIHASHPVDALKMMNFAYDPKVAGMIAAYVNYITPVPAAKDNIGDPELAKDPLIFPTDEMLKKVHRYRVLNADEERQWNALFEPIYQG